MITWLRHLMYDESFFEKVCRTIIFLLGELVRQGTIPTGVDGLGHQLGPIISALSLMISAGEKNPREAKKE